MTPAARIAGALAPLRREFTANVRLRLGVWAVLALVVFYWILVRADDLEAARADYAGDLARLERAQNAGADADWPVLLEAERSAAEQLTGSLWEAENEGLARAGLLSALNALAGDAGLRDTSVQPGVTQPVAGAPDVWRVQARLSARHLIGAELQLLHTFATHPKKLVVDRLDISQNRSRVTILVSAYFVGLTPQSR